jgi:hypothetical protein
MSLFHVHKENLILDDQRPKFLIGDLVTTVLGEYGIIIDIGEHNVYKSDSTEYYHVLICNYVQCYLSFALMKVKDKKCLTK